VRRSSRVILLLGILLAVGAFILIVFLNLGGRPAATPTPATTQMVVAAVDIPQGTTITASMITTREVALTEAPADSLSLPEQVIGRTARQTVVSGAYIPRAAVAAAAAQVVDVARELRPGERAVAIQVDELSGVGTLIQPGDRVDVIVGIPKANLPVGFLFDLDPGQDTISDVPRPEPAPIIGPAGNQGFQIIPAESINATTVKLMIQNARVVATLLSAVPSRPTAEETPAPSEPTLSGRQQLVIIAVSAQDAEVIRFALMEGTVFMALRSPQDAEASPDVTTGVILRTLIDTYGVLPPRLIVTENKGF
jgi:Flp pilus assembly protein CpaB